MPRAGLTPQAVTEAGARTADELGYGRLSMGVVAERLGVRTPSLYAYVGGLADLAHRVAVLATTELGDAIRDATQGRAGPDALAAAAGALRHWVTDHPGRYAATLEARPAGPDDPLTAANDRLLRAFEAVLYGYRLRPEDQVHALRLVRSALHGFVSLEGAGGFRYETDVSDSFTWLVTALDQGLRSTASQP